VSSGDLRTVTDDSAADHQSAALPVRQAGGRGPKVLSGEPLTAGGEERDDSGAAAPLESSVPGDAPSVLQRATVGPLIETKLHAPAVRKEWVQREELVGYLAGFVTSRLLLVEAPAGFGKTTAVAQWRASMIEDRPFAWISLDRGDNDPARLWTHVVGALQRACPEFGGGDTLRALRAQVPDVSGKVLPSLANELAALRAPVVVVLDDYHVISEPSCHDQVSFLLSHLPDTVQLVLATPG
jgi:ATP/maltotriose-dependent transcriptional regulator MalT